MRFKKIIKIAVLIIGFLFINNQTFAQETNDCKVCFTTAEEFDMILNMTNELINYIKTTGKEGDYIGDYINPNRYEGTKFNPPSNTKKLTNLILKSESLITTTALIIAPTKIGGIEDYIFGFRLMFKNKVFPRDYKKILDIESRISDKIYELGLGGGYYSNINTTNINDINKILKKYKEKGILSSAYVDKDIEYKDIVNQANRIASSLKKFLATHKTEQFFKFNGKITLNIDPIKINEMALSYECSNECNEKLSTVANSVQEIKDATSGGVQNAIKTIKKSIKKFNNEIGKIGTKNLFKNTLKVNGLSGIRQDIKNIGESFKADKQKVSTKEILEKGKTETEEKITQDNNSASTLNNAILGIISNHKEDLNYAIVSETKNSNFYFENLSKRINRNIEIAKEFKKNLIDSANLQCSK